MPSNGLRFIWITLLVLILDQWTKQMASAKLIYGERIAVIPDYFNITLLHNPGAAFSFLSDAGGWQRWFFTSVAFVVSIALIVWLARLPKYNRWLAIALTLILGGAIGNLWDRVLLGYVVDFIQVYYQEWYWPAFNIADSAISIGAVMLLIDAFRTQPQSAEISKEKG